MHSLISGILKYVLILVSAQIVCARTVTTINDSWRFKSGQSSVDQLDITKWDQVNLPHTWNAEDGYIDKNYFRGTSLYQKDLHFSKEDENQAIYLQFEGAMSFAQVYLNGKFVGDHKGGYTAFGFDITKFIVFGQKNQLLVKLNNENKEIAPLHGDFTIWGGIYRDIRIIKTDKLHVAFSKFADEGVMITTPTVNDKLATITAKISLCNQTVAKKNVTLQTIIRDEKGKTVTSQREKLELKADENKTIVLDQMVVENPELWSPSSPTLYTAETIILDAKTNKPLDRVVNNIGLRWYKVDAQKGFFLNGKHLKLVGVNRHQDFEGLGSALTDDFHRRDVQLMKEVGVNFLRIAHYPQDKALLDECDRQGIVAWEEIPIVDIVSLNDEFYKNCETNLIEMIRQHYNHPSVVMWGFMNETLLWVNKTISTENKEKYYLRTALLAHKLDSVAKKTDPSRYTTIAHHIDSAYQKYGLCDVTDILGWNVYKGWYGDKTSDFTQYMDAQHLEHPTRPLIVSEYGAGSDRRIHSQHGQMFDFSVEYQQQFHEDYLPYILERDYIVASSMWNMNDFGAADRDEAMPRINNKGLLYYDRTPKDVFYYYKSMLNSEKSIHIATRDWDMKTVQLTDTSKSRVIYPVKVYSNCNQVELFVDGISFGTKKLKNCNAVWLVSFKDGASTLIAKGVGNTEIVEDATTVNFHLLPFNLQTCKNKSLELGINCGVLCDFTDDKSKFTWLADQPYVKGSFGYVGGEMYRSKPWVSGFIDQIWGTRNVPLFQTIRVGSTGYRFDVPNGDYEVELSFTEPKLENQKILPLENVFDVIVNGELVLPSFNISENGGQLFAITKKIMTKVSANNGINIELKTQKGKSLISAIKVVKINE
ncbi:MAG: glycoside hydrolase family 2 TIM barrel-domain containing protein [Bacteroidales bacterium]|nr:glycoside hydrolase family 2 TIM barrel-domain containing protein [Bacteroidales bacterium]